MRDKKKTRAISDGCCDRLARRQCYRSIFLSSLAPLLSASVLLAARSAFEAWRSKTMAGLLSYRHEGSIENHRGNGEGGRAFGNNVKMGGEKRNTRRNHPRKRRMVKSGHTQRECPPPSYREKNTTGCVILSVIEEETLAAL